MQTMPTFWAVLPAKVRYDKRLSASEKVLFTELSAMTNVKGYSYATNRYFATLYDVSVSTVSRWISNLEKCNHIKCVYEFKDNNTKEQIRKIYTIKDVFSIADNDVIIPEEDNQVNIQALFEDVYLANKK